MPLGEFESLANTCFINSNTVLAHVARTVACAYVLFRLEQAVSEHSALIDTIAVGAVLGDADRAWIEAEDVGVVRCWLQDLLVRVPIDQGRALGKVREMVH